MKNNSCVSCKKSASDDAIQCEMCGDWEHKQRTKVSDELYVLLDKVPDNVKFFAPVFLSSFKGFKVL